MNIYVETNFVLELTFVQEQSDSCKEILELCESGMTNLILPAYSLVEPHEKLIRQAHDRQILKQSLDKELRQLKRTISYEERIGSIADITDLIAQSNNEEYSRFNDYRDRILNISEIIALDNFILRQASLFEDRYNLAPQDAVIYASVLQHLQAHTPEQACFLNRNSKDFDNPDIVDELDSLKCKFISHFGNGLNFIHSQI